MFIYSIIAFAALLITIVLTIAAIKGYHQFYWFAAISLYIFSFLAGLSIGIFTVVIAFVMISLAVGYHFGVIKERMDGAKFIGAGFIIGALTVASLGGWVFFPLFKLMNLMGWI